MEGVLGRGLESCPHVSPFAHCRHPLRPSHGGAASVSHGGREIHRGGARRRGQRCRCSFRCSNRPIRHPSCWRRSMAFSFTGSPSNVSPKHYAGAPRAKACCKTKSRRDHLPLLKAAIAAGVPVLCVCRGFQELNVALGGTLYQHVQEVPGRNDHREDKNADPRSAIWARA